MRENMIYAEAGAAILDGQLIMEDTGAKPIAAEFADTDLLGLSIGPCASGKTAKIYPVTNAVLEIDYYSSATATTLADTDIGATFDINVTSGDMTLDLDDTTGFLTVIGYDNDAKVAYVKCQAADVQLA